MILAIDVGNSRIKWGWHDGSTWIEQASLALSDLAQIREKWNKLPRLNKIVISHVAGEKTQHQLQELLNCWSTPSIWIASQSQQCGVKNSYATPTQLGSDRWAALIGARYFCKDNCIVVNAGTATTIDALSAEGIFKGGFILPGLELMQHALTQRAAGLTTSFTHATGQPKPFPQNTADAIFSGCLQAQLSTIEHMYKQLPAPCLCLLSGGAALQIKEVLNIPHRYIDNLVLEGLLQIAME